MLIRASGAITEDLFLLTLGASARYILRTSPTSYTLFNPGCSVQLPSLLDRLAQLSITPQQISYIVLTHLAANTVPAAVHLKRLNPAAKIIGAKSFADQLAPYWQQIATDDTELSALMPAHSAPSITGMPSQLFDYYLSDGESLTLSPTQSLCCRYSNGFAQQEASYLIEPLRFLIVNEVGGYFRGKELPAPAADHSTDGCTITLSTMLQLELAALCLPYKGVLTGGQVTRHLTTVRGVLTDVQREVVRATREGISTTEIRSQIMEGLFSDDTPDPFLKLALQRSGEQLWAHLSKGLAQS
jgi:hypothetical protein